MKKPILVVDDDKAVADTLQDALEMRGYTVVTANSGELAYNLLLTEKLKYGLVLMDVNMPGRE